MRQQFVALPVYLELSVLKVLSQVSDLVKVLQNRQLGSSMTDEQYNTFESTSYTRIGEKLE